MARLLRLLPSFLLLAIILTGCSPFIRLEQPVQSDFIRLENGDTIGQTFSATYRGLNGVALFLKPDRPGDGELVFQLSAAGTTEIGPEIANGTVPLDKVQGPGYYRLDFPSLPDSTNQVYYLRLENQANGSLQVAIGPGEAYLDGSAYVGDAPQDAQLAFRLAYDRTQAVWGLLIEAGSWLAWLGIGILLFLLPGWVILKVSLPDWDELWWAGKAGLSAGVSVAIYPILLLWTNLVGLHLGALYAWLPLILGLGSAIYFARRQPPRWKKTDRGITDFLPDLAMVLSLALLVFVRFWIIRGLAVPLWGDSYQHTLITQLLVENNGLFDVWQPYSESQSFTYHFGFHSLAAVFHWITHLPAGQATLWTGQILNIFAVLALVPLAVQVGHSRWAGVAAVFIAGFLLTQPQIYVNWGRYTQLAGQVVLPAAAYLGWKLISHVWVRKKLLWVIGLVMSGLALTHYRVLVFGGLAFMAAWMVEFDRRKALDQSRNILQAALLAIALFLPWFVRVFSGPILDLFAAQVGTPASQVSAAMQEFNAIGSIFDFMPAWLWLTMVMAIAWGLWRREKGIVLIGLWWLLNLLAANPQWLHLPGTGAIGSFTVLIACYIPASLLIGSAIGWIVTMEPRRTPAAHPIALQVLSGISILIFLVLVGAAVWGARQRVNDLDRFGSTLFTRADQRAADWIADNIPQDAVILVNSFLAYSESLAVGSDGGWWLPLQAGRRTTLPPINYATETGPRPDYTEWIKQLTRTLQHNELDSPEALDLLNAHGVTHVYIGQRQGSVNSPGALLTPEKLAGNSHFKLLYHEDRVWIFSFLRP